MWPFKNKQEHSGADRLVTFRCNRCLHTREIENPDQEIRPCLRVKPDQTRCGGTMKLFKVKMLDPCAIGYPPVGIDRARMGW